MTGLIARITAFATVALAILAVVAVYVTSRPELVHGGTEVRASFEDAYPLLEGMHVRVDGAVAGTVKEVELGDDGNAHVTMQLFEGTSPPRADALATIRQEDITGDSYVSLSRGDAPEMLGEDEIPPERTMSAPRFDDLLNAFNEPVRQGLELVFVQLGRTLEGRGEDLNEAALELRPGLRAANQALGELRSQNEALVSLIADAQRVTGQAAERSRELGGLVDGLAATLRTTSEHLPALDSALEKGPEALARTRTTLAKLRAAATAAIPLAETLREAAPGLVETSGLLGPFLDDAAVIFDDVEPTLALVTKLLRASEPTLEADPKRVFTAPFDLTAGVGAVLDTLIGNPALVRAMFGAECYGGRVCDPKDDKGLGAVPVEGGNLLGYPTNHPERYFIRAAAVGSCETFGVPIAPGCLAELPEMVQNLLSSLPGFPAPAQAGNRGGARAGAERGAKRGGDTGASDAPLQSVADAAGSRGSRGLADSVNETLDNLGLGGLGKKGKDGGSGSGAGKGGAGPANPVNDLLDFLLGP